MKTRYTLVQVYLLFSVLCFAQNGPWNNPLRMAWSTDGITFSTPEIFQDSAGVPSVIRWKGDTLAAAFQWFRQPNPSPTWDRVAVKFSYDNGQHWTIPVPIVISGMPANYQRPFDPTLTVFSGDSLRIYFSSSAGQPMSLDASVNTYSAKSADGIHYLFEPNARVDEAANRVIDPAVIFFNNAWHYAAPVGAPQQGAYHYISPEGLHFNKVPDIPSDNMHNWTGNYMVESSSELRFYGSGQKIWFNSSPNGGIWNGFVSTNIPGGDPSVVKVGPQEYLMVYVGQPYTTAVEEAAAAAAVRIFPNPASTYLSVDISGDARETDYSISDLTGKIGSTGKLQRGHSEIPVVHLKSGVYYLHISGQKTQLFLIGNR